MDRRDEIAKLKGELSASALELRLAVAKTQEEVVEALRSVAEATGTRPETLQSALKTRRFEGPGVGFIDRLRQQWGRISEPTKRIAVSAFLGLLLGLFQKISDATQDTSGIYSIAQILICGGALYNLALGKRRDLGAVAGALFGFAATLGMALFSLLFRTIKGVDAPVIIPVTLGSALAGYLLAPFSERVLKARLQNDPEAKRADLLNQLIELQDQLRQNEQVVTFLNVDVVDSTRIKAECDPLTSEYSFGEYTKFVVGCAEQFSGKLHSTAGDGVLLVFEHPQNAFLTARRLIAGLIEFNQLRNKTGQPFAVRCGIHTGAVMAPGKDPRSIAYSHVIDLSAHVQRNAPVNGIGVTEDAAIFLPGGPEAIGSETIDVQGKTVSLWRSQATTTSTAIAATPPQLPAS